jgi:hypothetical protein
MKPLLFFFVVFASLSANLGDSLIGRLGLKADYFSAALTSLICALLVIRRRLAVIITASILAVLASVPAVVTANTLDRDYLYGFFIAVLIAPYLADLIE